MGRQYKEIVQYACGCTADGVVGKDILEYCGTHGDDIQSRYPMLPPDEDLNDA